MVGKRQTLIWFAGGALISSTITHSGHGRAQRHSNGAQYPGLFENLRLDLGILYSEYRRFATEIKEIKVIEPKP